MTGNNNEALYLNNQNNLDLYEINDSKDGYLFDQLVTKPSSRKKRQSQNTAIDKSQSMQSDSSQSIDSNGSKSDSPSSYEWFKQFGELSSKKRQQVFKQSDLLRYDTDVQYLLDYTLSDQVSDIAIDYLYSVKEKGDLINVAFQYLTDLVYSPNDTNELINRFCNNLARVSSDSLLNASEWLELNFERCKRRIDKIEEDDGDESILYLGYGLEDFAEDPRALLEGSIMQDNALKNNNPYYKEQAYRKFQTLFDSLQKVLTPDQFAKWLYSSEDNSFNPKRKYEFFDRYLPETTDEQITASIGPKQSQSHKNDKIRVQDLEKYYVQNPEVCQLIIKSCNINNLRYLDDKLDERLNQISLDDQFDRAEEQKRLEYYYELVEAERMNKEPLMVAAEQIDPIDPKNPKDLDNLIKRHSEKIINIDKAANNDVPEGSKQFANAYQALLVAALKENDYEISRMLIQDLNVNPNTNDNRPSVTNQSSKAANHSSQPRTIQDKFKQFIANVKHKTSFNKTIRLMANNQSSYSKQYNMSLTPLCRAVKENKLKNVKSLVKEGANVHFADSHGVTPLEHAIRQGNQAIFKKLIELGAADNLQDTQSLFRSAAQYGQLTMAKTLVNERGYDISTLNSDNFADIVNPQSLQDSVAWIEFLKNNTSINGQQCQDIMMKTMDKQVIQPEIHRAEQMGNTKQAKHLEECKGNNSPLKALFDEYSVSSDIRNMNFYHLVNDLKSRTEEAKKDITYSEHYSNEPFKNFASAMNSHRNCFLRLFKSNSSRWDNIMGEVNSVANQLPKNMHQDHDEPQPTNRTLKL